MHHGYLPAVLCLALCACRTNRDTTRDQDNYEDSVHQAYGAQSTNDSGYGSQGYAAHRSSDDEMANSATTAKRNTAEAGYRSNRSLPAQDREFTDKAAQGGLLEVESSRLALRKNVSGHDREFAEMMISDHGKANRELEDLVRSKGVTPPTALDSEHQHEIDTLRQLDGVAFATSYRELQVKAHDGAIKLFERAARDCEDPDIKSFAARTLPTLRKHRSMLDERPEGESGQ